MRPLARLLAAALAVAAGPAAAGPSVTLNGVPIDGVTGQRFESCTVVIDARGDIHIEAKGYAVRGAEPAAAQAPAGGGTAGTTAAAMSGTVLGGTMPGTAKPTRRYFVVTEHDAPGTQYDLDVFVNSQWIRSVKAEEPQVVLEITKYVRAGPNRVTLAATKRIRGDRISYSRDVKLRVVVGEGNVGSGHVMIDDPLVEVTRTAAEIDDRSEDKMFEAR
jgi:hypothetical protein